jgi:beta-glucuronidase
MYSIANEPDSVEQESLNFFRESRNFVKSLDPTRPLLHTSHRHLQDMALEVDDVIALNLYYGTYTTAGTPSLGI